MSFAEINLVDALAKSEIRYVNSMGASGLAGYCLCSESWWAKGKLSILFRKKQIIRGPK